MRALVEEKGNPASPEDCISVGKTLRYPSQPTLLGPCYSWEQNLRLENLDHESHGIQMLAFKNGAAELEATRKELGIFYTIRVQRPVESLPVSMSFDNLVQFKSVSFFFFSPALTFV